MSAGRIHRLVAEGPRSETAPVRRCGALIVTLDDAVASVYTRLGYRPVAAVAGNVGRFNRHILIQSSLGAGTGEPDARPPAARGAEPSEAPDAPVP